MQQATPQAATAQLGNIGEPLPVGVNVADFTDAKGKLEAFADAIFNDPHCKGLYSKDEQDAVKAQVIDRALEYCKADGNISANDAMKLVRDNLVKINHQQTEDHKMVTGSDHGVRHIIQSNVTNTLNALDQLGENVSAKQKLMAMQIMIDHDLGYTTDAAKGSFKSAKDHPLASTAYMELGGQASNVFTPDEQKFMRDAVLAHGYPFGLDQPFDFHRGGRENAIAGIISVVDAMGTTQDTKCPALFREDPYLAILKQLASKKITENEAKQQLHAAIDANPDISQDVKAGYHQAVDYDVNAFGAGMIVPQFGGKLNFTDMEPQGDGKYVLNINMEVSEATKNLAGIVGNSNAIKAFNKLGEDMIKALSPERQDALIQMINSDDNLTQRSETPKGPENDITKETLPKEGLGRIATRVENDGIGKVVPLGGIAITFIPPAPSPRGS
ncbi:MAG: hypothetical protein LBD60_02525 [Puniceicoccales bacterium]|nr:hypothetical protein [Puniceicoccales bacterium]